MAEPKINFTFTRNPSTKVSITIELTGLVPADNELIIVGHASVGGGTATADAPDQIENFGDPVAVVAELDGLYGAGAEISEMIIAAINANFGTDLEPRVFPPITAISMTFADDDLASTLAANLSLPMPFIAVPFPISNASIMAELRTHLRAISASDRGIQSQFGSFGFMPEQGDLAAAAAAGEAAADEVIVGAWMRDLNVVKANKIHELSAALAALSAANGSPFLPLDGIVIGGLKPPTDVADRHTPGDAGSTALGLESGLVPLEVSFKNEVLISRTVTSRRKLPGQADSAYFDIQDWQALYFYRKNVFTRTQEDRFKRSKAFDEKLLALKSELLLIAKDFEELTIFQKVDELADQFKVFRSKTNRSAATYEAPVNVVPGFHNKGIGVIGTTQFDSFEIA